MDKLTKYLSFLVVLIAIFVGFTNYPPPPMSPIVYQWKNYGSYYKFAKYNIFYIDQQINSPVHSTLVCLHGFPTSSFDYFKLFPDLRKLFDRIIFIDFLGMGFSDKPVNHRYSIFEQADIVEAIVKHLGISSLHVLAHDYGDTVTQELLARVSENKVAVKIKTVTMMNGGIFPGSHYPLFLQKASRWPVIGFILSKINNRYAFSLSLLRVFGTISQPSPPEISDFWHIARHNSGYRVFGELLSYLDERWDNEERWIRALKATKIPLQFIYGPSDPVNPPPFDVIYHKLIPNPYFDKLPSTVGHYPHYEAPHHVFRSLDEFLQKANSTGKL